MASHALGYVQQSVTVAAALSSQPAGNAAGKVAIRTETNNIRFRDDGTNPTTAVGMLILTTDPLFIYDGEISKLVIIATAGTATVSLAYYS
jgi:hypothetical protein